jgi:hypothetical protein
MMILQVLNSDQNANTMKLKFAVKVNDHQLLENASTHWVGTGVNAGEEMLWVGQDSITFSKVIINFYFSRRFYATWFKGTKKAI